MEFELWMKMKLIAKQEFCIMIIPAIIQLFIVIGFHLGQNLLMTKKNLGDLKYEKTFKISGIRKVWLIRLLWEQEIVGSNPTFPTNLHCEWANYVSSLE
jgi:hypothetical protein